MIYMIELITVIRPGVLIMCLINSSLEWYITLNQSDHSNH